MGMYNEVYKKCPNCDYKCGIQISQIVYGFGEFNLEEPDSLADRLTVDQLEKLQELLVDKDFYCVSCATSFDYKGVNMDDQRKNTARRLFGNTSAKECPCCSFPNCGHDHF